MSQLTDKQVEALNETIDKTMFGVVYSKLRFADNPFVFRVEIMGECGEHCAVEKCNRLFQCLGILDKGKNLGIGDVDKYCELSRYSIAGKEHYIASFNHPKALKFAPTMSDSRFILGHQRRNMTGDAELKNEIMHLIDDLNSGKIRAKISEGRFVMEGDRYDRIEEGIEDKEWLLLSRGKLKRSVGIKTVCLYRADGTLKPKTFMRWKVSAVTLVDENEDECDATSIPSDFWPENILIHLGKRIA